MRALIYLYLIIYVKGGSMPKSMLNVKTLYNDKELTIECANLLGLAICEARSKNEVVILKDSGEVFDPIGNVKDWGILINAMLVNGFDLALDYDGIIVNSPEGMLTFNDKSIGRRLTRSFVELHSKKQIQKEVYYANN
jgi:hypothetical protein